MTAAGSDNHIGKQWLEPLGRVPRAIAAAALVLLAALSGALPFAASARAETAIASDPAGALRRVTPDQMRSGALLLAAAEEGAYVEAPRLGADYEIDVSGPTARTRVTQHFTNPTEGWVEAVYVYPLPEGAAVDTLRMVIGERIVIGEIKEREEARQIYEAAKREGKKAGLVEQERPNLFTNTVANIGPGETVVIQIEYQEAVRQSGNDFSLRLPLVVGPRYNPAPIVQVVDLGAEGQGWGVAADPVPDRDRISPPVLDPREHAPVNPLTITVRLEAGFELAEVTSAHHAIKSEATGPTARIVTLAEGAVPADRDFELVWRAAASRQPTVGLFREQVAGSDYVLALVTPPTVAASAPPRPREVVFVIDNSGSMGGQSIRQAKASLDYALARLAPADRFNVVRFDNTFDVLFPDTVVANKGNVERARAFVAGLEARGGTEMVPAMRAALADPRPGDEGFVRQVVFLTDGAIGNEQQLFDAIAASRARSRVFMVGIGSAPNAHLMSRAAELGRGTFTHIGSAGQVEERMRALLERLESPAVTGLAARFGAGVADVTPDGLPDLYRGEPLLIAARLARAEGTLDIEGRIGAQPWRVSLPLDEAAAGKGISKLWARRRITDAEVAATLGTIARGEADKRILDLGLAHHLVTRRTSLVAVEQARSRPDGTPLARADIPLNLPAGWDFDKVFGERRRAPVDSAEAGDARLQQAVAGAEQWTKAVASRAQPVALPAKPPVRQVALPQGATDAELRMLLGAGLLALSLLLLLRRRSAAAGR